MDISKGIWTVENGYDNEINYSRWNPNCITIRCDGWNIARIWTNVKDKLPQADANAELIAEAGTVANETGLTPRQLNEERKSYALTIKKIWTALGVMDYKAADGKSIDKLVLLVKQQRKELLVACEIGLNYTQGSSACTQPDCFVCKRRKEDIATMEQAIANAKEVK